MIEITYKNSTALLEVYECEVSPKGAVIVCPGGGYSFLSDRESAPVARAFTAAGYLTFVLYYEVEKEVLGDIPLGQLGKAVEYVRLHAKEFGLENKKITVCGFSAGGHLAASLGILWNRAEYFEEGTNLKLHRPDGMILAYPVITSSEAAHRDSMVRLAGEDREKQKRYSLECYVDSACVPTFLWGTAEDELVPVENSLLLLEKLAAHKVPVEYHLFPYGLHGLSLATKEVEQPENQRWADEHIARWMPLCVHWLDEVIVNPQTGGSE